MRLGKMVFVFGAFVGAAALLVSPAFAQPKKAKGGKFTFVEQFDQCTAPNDTHGAPLAFPACSPATLTSSGGTHFNDFVPNSGQGSYGITAGSSDVKLKTKMKDITDNGSPAGNTGQTRATVPITSRTCTTNPCTLVDIPFPVVFTYTAGAASVSTSANATIANVVQAGKAATTSIGQVFVTDGDTVDPTGATSGEKAFAAGIFIP